MRVCCRKFGTWAWHHPQQQTFFNCFAFPLSIKKDFAQPNSIIQYFCPRVHISPTWLSVFTMLTTSCIRRLAVLGRSSRPVASFGYVSRILGGGGGGASATSDLPNSLASSNIGTVTSHYQRIFCSKSGGDNNDNSPASIDHLFVSNKQWVDETNEIRPNF